MRRKNKKRLAEAVVLALVLGSASPVFAMTEQNVESNGKTVFKTYFYDEGEYPDKIYDESDDTASAYTLNDSLKSGVVSGMQYWADILGAGAKNPVQVIVMTDEEANASATDNNYNNDDETIDEYTKWALQNGMTLPDVITDDDLKNKQAGYYQIMVGKYLGADRKGSEYG